MIHADYQKKHRPLLVSIHGGHSADFCTHARDGLEEIIISYIDKGFAWIGITEHMPPVNDRFRYPEDITQGLTADDLYRQFSCYIRKCRAFQHQYAGDIQIAIGFETESYSGTMSFARDLITIFQPDYVVGSVHHVDDINFDCDTTHYRQAAAAVGGLDALYHRYFDIQYDMITAIRPAVVGHFDLIRIFDPDYRTRIEKQAIWKKIQRNLNCVKELGLILDFNVRALYKGAREPYITRAILEEALKMEITVVPGDDSHGKDTVGYGIKDGIRLLETMGFDTNWRLPVQLSGQ